MKKIAINIVSLYATGKIMYTTIYQFQMLMNPVILSLNIYEVFNFYVYHLRTILTDCKLFLKT